MAKCGLRNAECQRPISHSNRAFSLIELLIVLAIFGAILGGLLVSFLVGKSSYLSSDAYIQVQQEARHALDIMGRELREAGQVRCLAGQPGCPTGTSAENFSNQTRMDFQVVFLDATNQIVWGYGTQVDHWVHYLFNPVSPQNTQLVRCATTNKTDAVADFSTCRVLANNVSAPNSSFGYDSGNLTVTIQIQVQQASAQLPGGTMGTAPVPLTTQVRLRNTTNP